MIQILIAVEIVLILLWFFWLIGFPAWRYLRHEKVLDGVEYALGLALWALAINIVNFALCMWRLL